MIKDHAKLLTRLMVCVDFCLVAASFFLGYFWRGKIRGIYPMNVYIGLLPVLALIWVGFLQIFGMYQSFRVRKISDVLLIIFKSTVFGFLAFGSYVYIFKIQDISRLFIFLVFFIGWILLSLEKTSLILFFRHFRRKDFNYRVLLIVGTGKRAQHFIGLVRQHAEWGYKILGLIDDDEAKAGESVMGLPVVGSLKDVPEILHNNVVDEVVFVVPRSWLGKIEEVMQFCEDEGVIVHLAVDYFDLRLSKSKQTDLQGFPLLTFKSTSDNLGHLLIKRLFDVVAAGGALFFMAPLFAAVAAIIKITSPGPVFFTQERCSLNGRKFTLYKFRTMFEGAEAKLKDLLYKNEMQGPAFKMKNDPRITPMGKFLRKYSIDELPQFWNVLRGDMSLVGPRPPIPDEVDQYDSWHRRRLSMRPGITCLWQAGGRNQITDFNEWVKMDFEYIDNWSLWLDAKILAKTIPAVLFAKGAK